MDVAFSTTTDGKLTFRRDALTQGFKNATGSYTGPYTIVKALVDVN